MDFRVQNPRLKSFAVNRAYRALVRARLHTLIDLDASCQPKTHLPVCGPQGATGRILFDDYGKVMAILV
jgi:hypothetical protein